MSFYAIYIKSVCKVCEESHKLVLWWARLGSLHLLCFQLDHIWQFELGWLHFWLWQQCGHFHGESGRSVINTDSLILDF